MPVADGGAENESPLQHIAELHQHLSELQVRGAQGLDYVRAVLEDRQVSCTVVPPNTAALPILPPSQYCRPPNTAALPIPPPFQYRRPPNTAAHFQVPNKGFVGYIYDSQYRRFRKTAAFSEYRRFFASPKIGGIGGFDCTYGGNKSLVNLY